MLTDSTPGLDIRLPQGITFLIPGVGIRFTSCGDILLSPEVIYPLPPRIMYSLSRGDIQFGAWGDNIFPEVDIHLPPGIRNILSPGHVPIGFRGGTFSSGSDAFLAPPGKIYLLPTIKH